MKSIDSGFQKKKVLVLSLEIEKNPMNEALAEFQLIGAHLGLCAGVKSCWADPDAETQEAYCRGKKQHVPVKRLQLLFLDGWQ